MDGDDRAGRTFFDRSARRMAATRCSGRRRLLPTIGISWMDFGFSCWLYSPWASEVLILKFNPSEIRRRLRPLVRSALCAVRDTSAAKELLARRAPNVGSRRPGDPTRSIAAADAVDKDNKPRLRFFFRSEISGGHRAARFE